jgi:hypothetical protein
MDALQILLSQQEENKRKSSHASLDAGSDVQFFPATFRINAFLIEGCFVRQQSLCLSDESISCRNDLDFTRRGTEPFSQQINPQKQLLMLLPRVKVTRRPTWFRALLQKSRQSQLVYFRPR